MAITTLGENCYIDANQAYCDLVGLPREQLLGRPNHELRLPVLSAIGAAALGPYAPESETAADEHIYLLNTVDGRVRHIITSHQVEEWSGKHYLITMVQDLTDYERTQDALRSSETRFRLFFESMPLPVFVFDLETLRILDINPSAVHHYGYCREELLSMTMLDIRPVEEHDRFLATLDELPDDTRSVGIWKHRKKDGTIFDVDVTSYGLELDGRRTRLTVLQDVTEQLAMQEALRAGEERLRIIAEVTTDVIWDLDLGTDLVNFSYGMRSLFGHDMGDSFTLDWWIRNIHHEDRAATVSGYYAAVSGDGHSWSAQYRFRRSDREYAHVLDRGYILRDESGRPTRMIGAMVDITQQIELQEAAAQATMEERRRLARDLHDAVTQSLYSLSLMAEAARRRAQLGDEKATRDYIIRLGELAQQSLKEMRLLVYELRPSVLERDGLAGALQARLDAVERRSGIQASLYVDIDRELSPVAQLQFYRVAEEALNNALKHAAATVVRIRLRESEDSVTLEIIDNGKGFDPEVAAVSGGLGLVSMRERLEKLGGHFELDTAPGKGTTIRANFSSVDGYDGKFTSDTDM